MKKYLVPFDFTPITRNALEHALSIAQTDPGEIIALHVAANEEAKTEAVRDFEKLKAELETEGKKDYLTYEVVTGSIFKDLTKKAESAGVSLIIMGTHGARGLQKLIGSNAIRVINNSQIPFIITQSREPRPIKNILIPIDLTKERILITKFASDIAQKFNAEIHLVYQQQTDEFLKKRIKNNLSVVQKELNKKNLKYCTEGRGESGNLQEQMIEYARYQEIDLIAFAHFSEKIFTALNSFTQNLITNELGIPALIINAHEVTKLRTNYSFISI